MSNAEVAPKTWQQSGLKFLWITALILVADQVTKLWILNNLALMLDRIEVTSFFNIVHVRNYGAAFSFLADHSGWQRWFFTSIAIVISVLLLVLLRRQSENLKRVNISFALIIGGAVGNVIDRIRLGSVVDFLDVHVAGWHWPAFNVADSAIVVGALLMILDSLLSSKEAK
ncbi:MULTISPECIES: signal peptidase II [Gammaproteobacteria]|uniref:signal peptidase II n=1 Tax=Gammaproteobacteria TaxID=1236 RepID=UPI000DD0ADD3|nr:MULTISPECIES: signal peptidase II [Gammaproteobacteria]RTE86137.1 lipoprotein signal peptidase [Aliidiomarina sp. B3213]TCZ91490.1 lipoprotein signal peptidase [Lysobacter sp. N42]